MVQPVSGHAFAGCLSGMAAAEAVHAGRRLPRPKPGVSVRRVLGPNRPAGSPLVDLPGMLAIADSRALRRSCRDMVILAGDACRARSFWGRTNGTDGDSLILQGLGGSDARIQCPVPSARRSIFELS